MSEKMIGEKIKDALKNFACYASLGDGSFTIFSSDKKYRYYLSRTWDESKKKVVFIMINPSIANSDKNDPTISRCINMFKNNNNFKDIGSIHVVNIFPMVKTDIKNLEEEGDAESKNNKLAIETLLKDKNIEFVIVAWGSKDKLPKNLKNKFEEKVNDIKEIIGKKILDVNKLKCLGKTPKTQDPKHPLGAKYPKDKSCLEDYNINEQKYAILKAVATI